MGFLGLLILSLGAFQVSYCSKCIPETAECSEYWVKIEPHRNLMESEEELNSWCRKQALFYGCLQNVLLGSSKLSDLPTNLLISKMFAEDLCSEGSHSRNRYLNNAACINQLNTEYCTLPEYLDIVTPDDAILPSRCSLSEKTFSCIAATMVMNCGFDAGRVYRNLLKVTNYGGEVCDVESSEGIPPCGDPESDDSTREGNLSEIFYGLVHRFGVIPEQASGYDELPKVSLENTESNMDVDSIISDVISNALDAMEDSSEEENEIPLSGESGSLEFQGTKHKSDVEFQPESYQIPYITEPFKGLLHYNYSGREFALYWRQPDGFPLERVECDHVLPSFLKAVIFRCLLYRRVYEPPCRTSEKSRDEMITPELIRDVDPEVPDDSTIEFGPRPYWMNELDGYKKEKELREKSGTSRFSVKSPQILHADSVTEIPTQPAACTSETLMHEVHNPDFKWWKCENVFSPELREEIVSVLVPEVTEDSIPLMSSYHTYNIGYTYIYETRMHEFENITCARVNECHPRGRGVFKCSVFPRIIEKCDNCYEEALVSSRVFDHVRDILTPPQIYAKPRIEKDDATVTESSGSPDYETSSENVITLLLTDDETSVTKAEHDSDLYIEDIAAEEDGIVEMDVSSSEVPRRSEIDSSTDVHIVFLEEDPKESNEELQFLSDLAYAADEAKESREDRLRRLREAMGRPEYGLREAYEFSKGDENKVINETIFVLRSVPSNSDSEATYEVVDSPEDEISKDAIDEILSTI